jgi:hypothetical protein
VNRVVLRALRTAVLLAILLPAITDAQPEQRDGPRSAMRIGLHSGVQTSLLRYSVFPYAGEFQSTVEQNIVTGITFSLPFNDAINLQVDIGWWSQPWSASHDGDPRIDIERESRSLVEIPALVQYRPRSLPVPLYLAVGPVVSLLTDGEKSYTVRYTGFTEQDGWTSSTRPVDEETLHFGIAGEAGLDLPLGALFSVQMAVRRTQPLGKTVDERTLSLRELSIWRARLGLLIAL